jgi:CHAD domain-containing protein
LLAISELRRVGDPRSDDAIHEARRHIKKVRATIGLVQKSLSGIYPSTNSRMREACRLLAPVADGQAVIDTIGRVRQTYGRRLPPRTLGSIRDVLVERSARIDRKAELDRVLPRTARILRVEQARVPHWTLTDGGFRAVAPGLEKSFRRARKAMAQADTHPSSDNYHAWRQRVKDLWFQIRLLESRCGHKLTVDEHQLEMLDGLLGEHHNVILLERILVEEALVSRLQAARCLRVLRRYQAALRRRAQKLGRKVFAEKARPFVHRIKRLWQEAKRADDVKKVKGSWRYAA